MERRNNPNKEMANMPAFSNIIRLNINEDDETRKLLHIFFYEFYHSLNDFPETNVTPETLHEFLDSPIKEKDADRLYDVSRELLHILPQIFPERIPYIVNFNRLFKVARKNFLYSHRHLHRPDEIREFSKKIFNLAAFFASIAELYDIYADDENMESRQFATLACMTSHYTMAAHFRKIYKAITVPVTTFLRRVTQARVPAAINSLDSDEKNGAIMAKYAYRGYHNHPVAFNITPIPQLNRFSWYYSNSARFSLSLGLGGAVFQRVGSPNEIVVAFSGTNPYRKETLAYNLATDIVQYLIGPELVYFSAAGFLQNIVDEFKNKDIIVVGHSMGGGLTQFAISKVNVHQGQGIKGYGYNSAGLSHSCLKLNRTRNANITHICTSTDYISIWGQHLGTIKEIPTNIGFAHGIDELITTIFANIQECKI